MAGFFYVWKKGVLSWAEDDPGAAEKPAGRS
jgi:hypothetical protein